MQQNSSSEPREVGSSVVASVARTQREDEEEIVHEILAMNTLAMQRCYSEALDEANTILTEAYMKLHNSTTTGESRGLDTVRATTLNNLGVVECHRGQHRQALSHFEAARQLEESWNSASPAVALNTCAAYNALGMYDKATAAATETINMLRTLVLQKKEANSLPVIQAAPTDGATSLLQGNGLSVSGSDNRTLWGAAWHNLAVAQINTAKSGNDLSEYTNVVALFQNAMRSTQELLGHDHPMTRRVTENYRAVRDALRSHGVYKQHHTLLTVPTRPVNPQEESYEMEQYMRNCGIKSRRRALEKYHRDLTITFCGDVTNGVKLTERLDPTPYPEAKDVAFRTRSGKRTLRSLRVMPLGATLARACQLYGNPHPLLYSLPQNSNGQEAGGAANGQNNGANNSYLDRPVAPRPPVGSKKSSPRRRQLQVKQGTGNPKFRRSNNGSHNKQSESRSRSFPGLPLMPTNVSRNESIVAQHQHQQPTICDPPRTQWQLNFPQHPSNPRQSSMQNQQRPHEMPVNNQWLTPDYLQSLNVAPSSVPNFTQQPIPEPQRGVAGQPQAVHQAQPYYSPQQQQQQQQQMAQQSQPYYNPQPQSAQAMQEVRPQHNLPPQPPPHVERTSQSQQQPHEVPVNNQWLTPDYLQSLNVAPSSVPNFTQQPIPEPQRGVAGQPQAVHQAQPYYSPQQQQQQQQQMAQQSQPYYNPQPQSAQAMQEVRPHHNLPPQPPPHAQQTGHREMGSREANPEAMPSVKYEGEPGRRAESIPKVTPPHSVANPAFTDFTNDARVHGSLPPLPTAPSHSHVTVEVKETARGGSVVVGEATPGEMFAAGTQDTFDHVKYIMLAEPPGDAVRQHSSQGISETNNSMQLDPFQKFPDVSGGQDTVFGGDRLGAEGCQRHQLFDAMWVSGNAPVEGAGTRLVGKPSYFVSSVIDLSKDQVALPEDVMQMIVDNSSSVVNSPMQTTTNTTFSLFGK
ncbi:putative Tetratricopeptide repeat [Trypanosoma vivax]|uniref:Uncharacterized protein n=1 Tax=Trypanosoma vivax (strain Y486) TaxID=1055687 RepID=G0TYY3_TRYVY|nr:putative Tetratricopeptide repeat [Trypanosoma vivax]CCC49186.1 conserved hypothetical protein [Trypanosoma vivax Y486]